MSHEQLIAIRRPTRVQDIELKSGAIPSMLQTPTDREDTARRFTLLKEATEKLGLQPPAGLEHDNHFWNTLLRSYTTEGLKNWRMLREYNVPKPAVRELSLRNALHHTEQLIDRETTSLQDPLTGAWSRRALDQYMQHLIDRQGRLNGPTGVLFVDIDNFRDYNTRGGHALGDKVLMRAVDILNNNTRGYDMVGRYGGDEIAIILPEMPDKQRTGIRAQELDEKIKQELDITVSIGVTTIEPNDMSPKSPYRRADVCAYAAKKLGKNRAVMSTEANGDLVFTDLSTGIDYEVRRRIFGGQGYRRRRP